MNQQHHADKSPQFPAGFLFGAATSAHQVEGGNDKNDWWQWEQIPGHIADGTRSGRATDHYHRFHEDFDMAKKMNLNAQRISIEWSRIEPADGVWDAEAIAHYRQVLELLKSQGVTVMVTLWHFTLPQWVARQGGWKNKKTVRDFSRFAQKMASEYGALVDFWCTVNEPTIYLYQSYVAGVWPPGTHNLWTAGRTFFRIAAAHRAAYRAIHQVIGKTAQVGIAHNVMAFEPFCPQQWSDRLISRIADWTANHSFFTLTRGRHDFIGLNYYFHNRVAFASADYRHGFVSIRNRNEEVSAVGWEVYAPGLGAALKDMDQYHIPIYITENGIATTDEDQRIRFLLMHLAEVHRAIAAGVDVRGYFYWSLLDNFEWEKGFGPRFGLIAVNYETGARTVCPAAEVYGEIARTRRLS